MGSSKLKILLVEDDLNIGFLTMDYLESENFEVILCRDGEEGYNAFKANDFDVCVLDVMMPKLDGFQLGKLIRKDNPTIPLIFLTAKNMKEDKYIGFNLGADDYLSKPFDEEELLWRINAVLKRVKAGDQSEVPDDIKIGRIVFSPANQLLTLGEYQQRLTERETLVLLALCKNKGNIIRREELLNSIWGENDYFAGRSLDVFIAKLRKYLKVDKQVTIENIPRVGFVLKG